MAHMAELLFRLQHLVTRYGGLWLLPEAGADDDLPGAFESSTPVRTTSATTQSPAPPSVEYPAARWTGTRQRSCREPAVSTFMSIGSYGHRSVLVSGSWARESEGALPSAPRPHIEHVQLLRSSTSGSHRSLPYAASD